MLAINGVVGLATAVTTCDVTLVRSILDDEVTAAPGRRTRRLNGVSGLGHRETIDAPLTPH